MKRKGGYKICAIMLLWLIQMTGELYSKVFNKVFNEQICDDFCIAKFREQFEESENIRT